MDMATWSIMSRTVDIDYQELRNAAQRLLNRANKGRKVTLKVSDCTPDGDWVIVMVTPARGTIRAYDFVEILTAVEEKLQGQGYDRVRVLPAFPGD